MERRLGDDEEIARRLAVRVLEYARSALLLSRVLMSGFREKMPIVETKRVSESEQAVRLLESLIDSTAFETQVISVHARKYQDKLTDVQRAIQTAVKEQLKGRKALEEEAAFMMINEAEPGRFADVKEVQRTL